MPKRIVERIPVADRSRCGWRHAGIPEFRIDHSFDGGYGLRRTPAKLNPRKEMRRGYDDDDVT